MKDQFDLLLTPLVRAMKLKLRHKEAYGWHGWFDESFTEELIRKKIYNQVRRKLIDPVDIANYAAFLYYKQQFRLSLCRLTDSKP